MSDRVVSKPRNCRHCTWMTCGDANYCSGYEILRTDYEIRAHTDCSLFEWNPIDALTLQEWTEHEPNPRHPVLEGQEVLL